MSDEDLKMSIRRAEWEIEALKESYSKLDEKVVSMKANMDSNHREIMAAIGSLKDDKARREGAAEAELVAAAKTQLRLKVIATVLAAATFLAGLGWLGSVKDGIPEVIGQDTEHRSE